MEVASQWPTFVVLLSNCYKLCPVSGCMYVYCKSPKIWVILGGGSVQQVKHLTMGYITRSVNEILGSVIWRRVGELISRKWISTKLITSVILCHIMTHVLAKTWFSCYETKLLCITSCDVNIWTNELKWCDHSTVVHCQLIFQQILYSHVLFVIPQYPRFKQITDFDT